MKSEPQAPLGTVENPLPSWALLRRDAVREFCASAGKTEEEFSAILLPQLAKVVQETEVVMREKDVTKEFSANDILRMIGGKLLVKIFTCVNFTSCNPKAEGVLIRGVRKLNKDGWHNIDFDFNREDVERTEWERVHGSGRDAYEKAAKAASHQEG